MTKAQKAQRSQARHQRQVARRLEKKQAIAVRDEVPDDEEADLEEGDDLEELDSPEEEAAQAEGPAASDEPEEIGELPVRKDYMGDMASPMSMPMGPTSFDELDEQRTAQEQAAQVRETTWDVQDMVRNIMANPSFDTAAKSAAIQKVGSDFGDRVTAIMNGKSPDDGEPMEMQKSLDMDLLYLEAVVASDHRHLSFQESMSDWFAKAKLSYAAKQAKGDSAYALVTTRGGVKVRKYLIHDKAHVRNALARAAQMMKRGGMAAADAKAALPKIHAAAKRMGIGMGKANDANAVILEKDAKGDWRWVGWASNNFMDWHGQIISKEAHEEYVAFLDANPTMAPLFMTWHTPGTDRKSPVDYWAFEKGFLILSGKLEEGEAAALLKAQTLTDLGLSIAGIGFSKAGEPNVISQYRMVEVSDLPLENAANPFTDFSVLVKEVQMEKKEYLAAILGSPEKAAEFMEKTGMKQEALTKAGVAQKEKEVEPAAPAVEPKPAATDAQAVIAEVFKEMDIEGLNAFVKDAREAMEKVPLLEAVVKELQTNQDEKLAEKITPPAARFAWASQSRASASDDTVIQKESKLAKRVPALGDNWLNEATNTTPLDPASIQQ